MKRTFVFLIIVGVASAVVALRRSAPTVETARENAPDPTTATPAAPPRRLPAFVTPPPPAPPPEVEDVLANPHADSKAIFGAYRTEVCACSDYACFASLATRYTDKLAAAPMATGADEIAQKAEMAAAQACITRLRGGDRPADHAAMVAERQAMLDRMTPP